MTQRKFISAVVMLGLAMTVPAGALAQMPRAAGVSPQVARPTGVSSQMPAPTDRPCPKHCRDGFRVCLAAASAEARLCRDHCKDLVQAAQEACATDDTSDACKTARDAAHACIQTCVEPFKATVHKCRNGARACVAICPRPWPVKDPQCLKACGFDLAACRDKARTAAHDCAVDCDPLVQAARQACTATADHISGACKAARDAAQACLQPCRETLQQEDEMCMATGHECVTACPDLPSPAATE